MSKVKGVHWESAKKAWRVCIQRNGVKSRAGGIFRPEGDTRDEMERARLAAEERRRELELRHFGSA